jgi:hypothetical protein
MAKKESCDYSVEFKRLCTPAMIYFLVSTFGLFLIGLQNLNGNNNLFCLGSFKCSVSDKITIMLFHVIYILFWTFVLDLFCKTGYSKLSWFIILIPILLMFVAFGILILNGIMEPLV